MRISDWSSDVCSSDLSGFSAFLHRQRVVILVFQLGKCLHGIGESRKGFLAVPRAKNFVGARRLCLAFAVVIIGHILLLHSELDPGADLPTDRKSTRLNSSH